MSAERISTWELTRPDLGLGLEEGPPDGLLLIAPTLHSSADHFGLDRLVRSHLQQPSKGYRDAPSYLGDGTDKLSL